MISVDSETAKISDMFELRKTFAFLKTWKSHFPSLKHQMLKSVCFIRCVDPVENAFLAFVKLNRCFCLHKYCVLNAMYCILEAPTSGFVGGPQPSSAGPA